MAHFALFLQSFLPLAQAFPAASDGVAGRMLICTLYGAQMIDLVTDDGTADNKSGAAAGSCPICMAYSIGFSALNAPVEQKPFVRNSVFAALDLPQVEVVADQTGRNLSSARAPPLTVQVPVRACV